MDCTQQGTLPLGSSCTAGGSIPSNREIAQRTQPAQGASHGMQNGRVDLQGPNTAALFQLYDRIPANQCAGYRDATQGNWYNTALSDTFFSKENIQVLQNGIRAGVYSMSNGQYHVGEQSCDQLMMIMRSVFLQSALNQPDDIPGQVAELNRIVLDYAVAQVYGEAQAYLKYRYDVSTLAVPLSAPVMSSTYDKQLELKHFF